MELFQSLSKVPYTWSVHSLSISTHTLYFSLYYCLTTSNKRVLTFSLSSLVVSSQFFEVRLDTHHPKLDLAFCNDDLFLKKLFGKNSFSATKWRQTFGSNTKVTTLHPKSQFLSFLCKKQAFVIQLLLFPFFNHDAKNSSPKKKPLSSAKNMKNWTM
jgi:hypothetical protein